MVPAHIKACSPVLQRVFLRAVPEYSDDTLGGRKKRQLVYRIVRSGNGNGHRRLEKIGERDEEPGVSGGIVFRLARKIRKQLFERFFPFVVRAERLQPHKIIGHQGIAAGDGSVVAFFRAKQQRFVFRAGEVKTALLPVEIGGDGPVRKLRRARQIGMVQRGFVQSQQSKGCGCVIIQKPVFPASAVAIADKETVPVAELFLDECLRSFGGFQIAGIACAPVQCAQRRDGQRIPDR